LWTIAAHDPTDFTAEPLDCFELTPAGLANRQLDQRPILADALIDEFGFDLPKGTVMTGMRYGSAVHP